MIKIFWGFIILAILGISNSPSIKKDCLPDIIEVKNKKQPKGKDKKQALIDL